MYIVSSILVVRSLEVPRAPSILVVTYTARIAASYFAHSLSADIDYRRAVTWLGTPSNAALTFDGVWVSWPAVLSHGPDGGLAM